MCSTAGHLQISQYSVAKTSRMSASGINGFSTTPYRLLWLCVFLSLSLFCSLCLKHNQAGWFFFMSHPTWGYFHLFWQRREASASLCLWTLWRCEKKTRAGSQLVVMNVSQSAWSLCLTSKSAQFLLYCVQRQIHSDGWQWQKCDDCGFFAHWLCCEV